MQGFPHRMGVFLHSDCPFLRLYSFNIKPCEKGFQVAVQVLPVQNPEDQVEVSIVSLQWRSDIMLTWEWHSSLL